MDAHDINSRALEMLEEQNFDQAQCLFFENAQAYPSHATYHNLGCYLIDFGYSRSRRRMRPAFRLGVSYLRHAARIQETAVTLCALACALEDKACANKGKKRQKYYNQAHRCWEKAVGLSSSQNIYYNYLRSCYLCEKNTSEFLHNTHALAQKFPCEETLSLYFAQLLSSGEALMEKGLCCIKQHVQLLDALDMLIFYVKHGLYTSAYELSHTMETECIPNHFMSAAILECYLHLDLIEQATTYAKEICSWKDGLTAKEKRRLHGLCHLPLHANDKQRTTYIAAYRSIPPRMSMCFYFGCEKHSVPWPTN